MGCDCPPQHLAPWPLGPKFLETAQRLLETAHGFLFFMGFSFHGFLIAHSPNTTRSPSTEAFGAVLVFGV
jgi:hypothetical protein